MTFNFAMQVRLRSSKEASMNQQLTLPSIAGHRPNCQLGRKNVLHVRRVRHLSRAFEPPQEQTLTRALSVETFLALLSSVGLTELPLVSELNTLKITLVRRN